MFITNRIVTNKERLEIDANMIRLKINFWKCMPQDEVSALHLRRLRRELKELKEVLEA